MSFPLIPRGRAAHQAFTLVELLTVIAIIGILSALTFGLFRGVSEQSRIGRAKAELGTLASALEAYKKYYGEYPLVATADTAKDQVDPKASGFTPNNKDRAYNVFRALTGRFAPDQTLNERQISKTSFAVKNGKSFIDPKAFALERNSPATEQPLNVAILPQATPTAGGADPDYANALLDPWGNRYQYYYKQLPTPATWRAKSYLLFSAGPDGLTTAPSTTGNPPDPADAQNADNIYLQP